MLIQFCTETSGSSLTRRVWKSSYCLWCERGYTPYITISIGVIHMSFSVGDLCLVKNDAPGLKYSFSSSGTNTQLFVIIVSLYDAECMNYPNKIVDDLDRNVYAICYVPPGYLEHIQKSGDKCTMAFKLSELTCMSDEQQVNSN